MKTSIFFLVLAFCICVMVIAQVRNQKMREKYAALWLVTSGTILILAAFPNLLEYLADLVGVVLPVNLLFLLANVLLIGVSLHLTLALSKLGEETRILAEEVAILRTQLEQHESQNSACSKEFPTEK